MRILVLSKYPRRGSSSRLRFYQYLPALERAGISCECRPLFDDSYLDQLYSGRQPSYAGVPAWYGRRLGDLGARHGHDLLWIEGELFPWLPAFVDRLFLGRRPYVLDFDDAMFHRYDQHFFPPARWLLGRKLDRLMAGASLVVVGNEYLAARAAEAGARRVEIVPTVLDLSRYRLGGRVAADDEPTIGWIGSPHTTVYLRDLVPVMLDLSRRSPFRFLLVGAAPVPELAVLGKRFCCEQWREEAEAEQLSRMDIGVMPLPDEAFPRGKCGYKLIQYMAMALPAVASPVGANRAIIQDGQTGYFARDDGEWTARLRELLRDGELRRRLGRAGRATVEREYTLERWAPRMVELLRSAI